MPRKKKIQHKDINESYESLQSREVVQVGHQNIAQILIYLLIALVIGLICGYFAGSYNKEGDLANKMRILRLTGYKFISPLLVCDLNNNVDPAKYADLKDKITSLAHKDTEGDEGKNISIYYRDLNSGNDIAVNPEVKYAPSSLNKIPVMIAYYKAAETNPDILTTRVTLPSDGDDKNTQQIKPKEFAVPGKSYTVNELIEKMIIHSDNNSFYFLTGHIDESLLEQTYRDLKIEFPTDPNADPNFITASDFSYFLRVLYNATYLTRDHSEKALSLLNQVDFKDALVAGIPSGIAVPHKFGTWSKGATELHDCGIVYHPQNPYLVCVMTKGYSKIVDSEAVIKDISALIYSGVDSLKN